MKRIVTLTSLVALSLTMVAATADARRGGRGRGGGFGPGHRGDGFGPRIMGQLDLTAEQQQEIQAMRVQLEATITPIEAQLDTLRVEMRSLWRTQPVDREAVAAKQAAMDPLRAQIRQARMDFKANIINLLTAEQHATFVSLSQQGPQNSWGCGQGRGRGRGQGGGYGKGSGRGAGRGNGGQW